MAEDAADMEELREQDRFLPIANISRIMKKSLPDNAKIAKDAKETVQVRKRGAGERRGVISCVFFVCGWSLSINNRLLCLSSTTRYIKQTAGSLPRPGPFVG